MTTSLQRFLFGLVSGAALSFACTDRYEAERCEALLDISEFSDAGAEGAASSADAGFSPNATAGGASSQSAPVEASSLATGTVTDDYASDVSVSVHDRVRTVLVVTWTQVVSVEEVWLEFQFEGGPVMRSRPAPGALGEHRDVVLGVPELTDVTVRIVSSDSGSLYVSRDYQGTTLALPGGIPRPSILAYDPSRSSPERWLFGSVEDSPGGSDSGYYFATFWLYIMDRQGRIVWYYADPASNATSSFQRIARDGEYIWIEKRPFGGAGERGVLKMTLDHEYFEEIPVPGLSDCIDVTDDGSLLYDVNGELRELDRDGEVRSIFSCREHFGPGFVCYSNTVNWYPKGNTVLLSFPVENTVVEIARASGEVVGQYGNTSGSFRFAPPATSPPSDWVFSFQHFPNISPDDTLMVSSHVPGCGEHSTPGPRRHAFLEFEIDRRNRRLVEKWRYVRGGEWPRAKGMAIRLSNGNTLANYGTGGVIREISPDKRTVFHVKFDVPEGSDFYNKMVGHNVFIDDLYALNGGP